MQASTAYVLFYKKKLKFSRERPLAKDQEFQPAPCHDGVGSSVDIGSCVDNDKHNNRESSLESSAHTSVAQSTGYNLSLQKSNETMAAPPSQSICEIDDNMNLGLDNIPTVSAALERSELFICEVESNTNIDSENVTTGSATFKRLIPVRKCKFVVLTQGYSST